MSKKLEQKKKLNIIKYNKKILKKLQIIKEDFKVYEIIKELNEKKYKKINRN